MARPRSDAPFVVVSVRVHPDMATRIDALGPRPDVLRQAIERGLASLERSQTKRLGKKSRTYGEMSAQVQRMARTVAKVERDVNLQNRVLRAIANVDFAGRHGNLVPIGAVRTVLPNVTPAKLDAVLLDLEARHYLDLKFANDSATAPGGIEIPGRGHAWWVSRR